MTQPAAPLIALQGVSLHYHRSITALRDTNLELSPGTITALIGPNGAGKSSLFKCIMGIETPSAGSIDLAAGITTATIAYVPQHEDVNWNFPVSVRDVVTMGVYHQGSRWLGKLSSAQQSSIQDALAATDLTDLASRHISALSGGQKKRTFVARGLAQGARVMLLDEPFAGVDHTTEASLIRLIQQLRDSGTCILVATHNLEQIPAFADRVAMLNRTIIATGPVAETLTTDNLLRTFGGNHD